MLVALFWWVRDLTALVVLATLAFIVMVVGLAMWAALCDMDAAGVMDR